MESGARHSSLLAELDETTGSTIHHIAAAHPTETDQPPIDSAAQLGATPSPTGRQAQETRSDVREEISRVIAAVPGPATGWPQAAVIAAAPEPAIVRTQAALALAEEVPTASEAATFPVPPGATAAPSDQVPREATTVPRHDPPVAAGPPASAAAVAEEAAVAAEAGVVKEEP